MLPTHIHLPIALGDMLHAVRVGYAKYLQNKWEVSHSNHLFAIKPKLRLWPSTSQGTRKREVLLARLRCGHTRATHGHLLDRSEPPMCHTCNVRLTVEHILVGCAELALIRRQLTSYLRTHDLPNNLKTLLGDDDPTLTELLLDFVTNSHFSDKL